MHQNLLHEAFTDQKNLDLEWYHNINNLIVKHGNGTYKYKSINCRVNIKTMFNEHWKSVKQESPKLEFYNSLKNNFGYESYLDLNNHQFRKSLSKLRISAHNLFIERGRYAKTYLLRDDRICLFCSTFHNNKVIESELHAIDSCPLYKIGISNILKDTEPCAFPVFANCDQTLSNNILAGRIAHHILTTNDIFLQFYYANHESIHTGSGKCLIM